MNALIDRGTVPKDALSWAFAETRQTQAGFLAIDTLMANPRTHSHGHGLLVLGPARCGKTTFVREYLLRCRAGEDGRRPLKALYVEVSVGARLNTISRDTLQALNDPDPDYGDQGKKTDRVIKAIVEGRYDLVIFDEVHHLVDTDTLRVQQKAASWLTLLLNKTFCPMILVGYEGFRNVVRENEFLAGRLLPFAGFRPHRHDDDDEDDLAEFGFVLSQMEGALKLPEPSRLYLPRTAARICVTCKGRFGLVESFLTYARELARRRNHSCLTDAVLSETAEAMRGTWHDLPFNPFEVPDLEEALRDAGPSGSFGSSLPKRRRR